MAFNGLPKSIVTAEMAEKHDKRVIRDDNRESRRRLETAIKNDPEAQKWYKKNRHIWR